MHIGCYHAFTTKVLDNWNNLSSRFDLQGESKKERPKKLLIISWPVLNLHEPSFA